VIPTQDSVQQSLAGGVSAGTPNVLLDEYFEIYSALLR
jgi:hypothetical protein